MSDVEIVLRDPFQDDMHRLMKWISATDGLGWNISEYDFTMSRTQQQEEDPWRIHLRDYVIFIVEIKTEPIGFILCSDEFVETEGYASINIWHLYT